MASTDDMMNAVQALLRDMRSEVEDPSLHANVSPRHVAPAGVAMSGGQLADIDALRAEIGRLESELHGAHKALEHERHQHAQTRELLRLALRSSAVDSTLEGSPLRKPRKSTSPSRKTADRVAAADLPSFVRHASAAQQHLSPRAYQSASNTVMDLFSRVTNTPRRLRYGESPQRQANGAGGGPSVNGTHGAERRSSSASSRRSGAAGAGGGGAGGGRGTASVGGYSKRSSNAGPAVPFGSKAERFQNLALNGHHSTFVNRSVMRTKDELSREEAKALARDMRKSGLTPRRTSNRGADGGPLAVSPIVTGTVRAPPSASTLRSPDIAQWVRQLHPRDEV
jgi:hypothetical protein